MSKPQLGTQLVRECLKKFPDAATMTLAKKLYKANPGVWNTLETCRAAVRRVTGTLGKGMHGKTADKSQYRKPGKTGDPFPKLPEGKTEFTDWGAVQIDGPLTALVLSDVHIPYHDRASLTLALQRGLDRGADTIVLNGDFLDCFALKSWETDPRNRDFAGELQTTIDTLDVIREAFPDARIIYKIGNHEERYERYMILKAPEFLDVAKFQFPSVFEFERNKIEEVRDKRPIKLGKLNVIHGHEYRFSISNPVSPARGLFLRGRSHAVCGHFHQPGHHSGRTLEQNVLSCWSTGCLCDLHPGWLPMNEWCHGFAIVTVDDGGAFRVDNLRIIEGKIYE